MRYVLLALRVLILAICSIMLTSCHNGTEKQVLELTKVNTDQTNEDVQRKISDYQKRVLEDPTNAVEVGNLGVIYELHGFSSEALAAYELATILDPSEFRWPYFHSILLAARFDLAKGIEKIEDAIKVSPEYGPAWIQMGSLQLDNGQFKEALASFKHAESLVDDPYTDFGQALAYLELNEFESALATLENLGKLAAHPHVQRIRGAALLRSGKTKEGELVLSELGQSPAIRWEDPLVEQKDEHVVDHFGMQGARAQRFIRSGSYESALLELLDLRDKSPSNRQVLFLLSKVYRLLEDSSNARLVLEEAVKLHPDFYSIRTEYASLLAEGGRLEESIEQLDAAIDIDSTLHWAFVQKGHILMERKQWLEASLMFEKALNLKSDDASLYTFLGICLGFLNRWPEAANVYRVATQVDPNHVQAHINLARAETFLGNESAAIDALSKAEEYGASPELIARVERQRDQIKKMEIKWQHE